MSVRSCRTEGGAGCARCCIDLTIDQPDIKKPAGVPCPKLVDDGHGGHLCSIYDKGRPRVCRDYRCGWVKGVLDEEDRPDKSGVIVAEAISRKELQEAFQEIRAAGMGVWRVIPIPGANVDKDKIHRITRRLQKDGAVITEEDPGILGNNKAMRIFFRWLYGGR